MKNLAELLLHFAARRRGESLKPEDEICFFCGFDLSHSELYLRFRICDRCGFHYIMGAQERIGLLADEGTFKEANRYLVSLDPLSFLGGRSYRRQVFEAQKRTELSEAAITGTCSIGDNPAVLALLDFRFLGGSMGCVVGEKIALAFELAISKKLPVITIVASGGARMQEGVLSLMQMAKTAAAVHKLDAAGLLYISVLGNPTTGEVYSSFANLGDIIIAEPGALMGFAPLRVVEQATGTPLPRGCHTAESHLKHGMVDQVVDRTQLKDLLTVLLNLFTSNYELTVKKKGRKEKIKATAKKAKRSSSAWQTVQLARHEQRPTASDYIGRITSSFVEIRGDRAYGDDPTVMCGIADIVGGQAVVIIGQERNQGGGQTYPEGFRKAQRAMKLAAKLGAPLINLIDTRGAYPGLDAEERGVGSAIAGTMALMSDLPVPIISVIIGEGGSEGALALGVADRILMLENAIYSVVSPEGAASLLYRNADKAEELARALRITAQDCKELGVVDAVVPEPEGGAHLDHNKAARLLRQALLRELVELQAIPVKDLVKARYRKFRQMGEYNSRLHVALSKEMIRLQDFIQRQVKKLRREMAQRRAKEKAAIASEPDSQPELPEGEATQA